VVVVLLLQVVLVQVQEDLVVQEHQTQLQEQQLYTLEVELVKVLVLLEILAQVVEEQLVQLDVLIVEEVVVLQPEAVMQVPAVQES
jgi:hypothetical protein